MKLLTLTVKILYIYNYNNYTCPLWMNDETADPPYNEKMTGTFCADILVNNIRGDVIQINGRNVLTPTTVSWDCCDQVELHFFLCL